VFEIHPRYLEKFSYFIYSIVKYLKKISIFEDIPVFRWGKGDFTGVISDDDALGDCIDIPES